MIYLFNSAFRSKYTANVLRTLSIPIGGANKYRYRHSATEQSPNINIDPSSIEELKSTAGQAAVIVFIDRWADNGYKYYPLRLAEIINVSDKGHQLFFNVQLNNYIYPHDIDSFNNNFKSSFRNLPIPRLTDGEPENMSDGNYAVRHGNLFTQSPNFLSGDAAWSKCVVDLSKCHIFSDDNDANEYIFTRSKVSDADGKTMEMTLVDRSGVFELVRNAKYELELSYYYPSQIADTGSELNITVESGENIKSLNSKTLVADALTNTISFGFATKRYIEDGRDRLSFLYESPSSGSTIRGSDFDLSFQISESRRFWVLLFVALVAFAISSIYLSANPPDHITGTLNKITYIATTDYYKIIAGFLQAIVLFFLLRLVGGRFL